MDEHLDRFRDRYATFRKTHDLPSDDNMQMRREDMQQQIDFAVSRALEKHPLRGTLPNSTGHGFGSPGVEAQIIQGRTESEAVLAEVLAVVEKLASCVTTPIKMTS